MANFHETSICPKCEGSGVRETGNNDLPCDCPAGDTALFNICGVKGPITGAESKRHFLNGAPEPIDHYDVYNPILAKNLPGRK